MNKEDLIKAIKEYKPTTAHNFMGCSENWYSPIYAIKQTFTIDEIQNMKEDEIQHLFKLADNIQEGLY